MSDFTQPKPKVVAGKNAMALVGKKKYHLACSFFLLAQDLQGAVQVAIERCQDPVLAVLMCRIQDPKNETKVLTKMVEQHFIQRGTKFNDPYLRSLGMWLTKDFVKAVNELNPIDKSTNYEFLLQQVPEFDLTRAIGEGGAAQTVYPPVSESGYESMELMVKLRKSPDVKRMLNSAWATDKQPKKSSIFDDFLADDSESEEEQAPKEAVQVEEHKILSRILDLLIARGQTPLAMLQIQESRDFVSKLESDMKQDLANTLMLDRVLASCSSQVESTAAMIRTGIKQIQDLLKVQASPDFMQKKLK